MSCSNTIAFYGIRLEVAEDEMESVEDCSHPAMISARKAGLQHYWDNFGLPGELYFLFIGRNLGVFGVENQSEFSISAERLSQIAAEVSGKLSDAGFTEPPALLIQFQSD